MILVPTKGPEDWKQLLADPDLHWKPIYSAYSLAYRWETASGFPNEVQSVLSKEPALNHAELLLAIPEYKVSLPGGRAASQNDIFCLAKGKNGLASIMVEGKVDEPFGELVTEWYVDPSPGKIKRLNFLCQNLHLDLEQVQTIRYQLLHRTVSAMLEAQRFNASTAIMLVHSFSKTNRWFEDYNAFAMMFGIDAKMDKIHFVGQMDGIQLYLAWVKGSA